MEVLGQPVSIIEIAGTIFGIAGVWLTVKKNIWCFPTGIINVVLYAVLFFQTKLYADCSLQIIYIVLLIYGWIQWHQQEVTGTFVSESTARRLSFTLIIIGIISTAI